MSTLALLLARIAANHRASAVATPVLDSLTAAPSAAYSLRKLRGAYAGAAINVRRSSDGTTQDIGFTSGGDPDTTALLAFCGSGDGFVTKWYDQSGNGRDASQATAALQPIIVTAGAARTKNAKPTIYWNSHKLSATVNTFSAGFAVTAVAGVNVDSAYNGIVSKTNGTQSNPFDFWSTTTAGNAFVGNGTSSPAAALGSVLFKASTGLAIWTYQATTASGAAAFANGAADSATPVGTAYADSTNPVNIGTRGDGGVTLNGWISEVVLMPGPLSTADRHTLERNQGGYYGVTVA